MMKKSILTIATLAVIGQMSWAAPAMKGKKPTALDKFLVQSVTENKGLKRHYEEQQTLSRTTLFKPEGKTMEVELGAAVPEWGGGQVTTTGN